MSDPENNNTRYDHLSDEQLTKIVQELAAHDHIAISEPNPWPISVVTGNETTYSLLTGYNRGTTALTDTTDVRPEDVRSKHDLNMAFDEALERNLVAPVFDESAGNKGHSR